MTSNTTQGCLWDIVAGAITNEEKSIITGITGVVGSQLADFLLANTDWEVYGMYMRRKTGKEFALSGM